MYCISIFTLLEIIKYFFLLICSLFSCVLFTHICRFSQFPLIVDFSFHTSVVSFLSFPSLPSFFSSPSFPVPFPPLLPPSHPSFLLFFHFSLIQFVLCHKIISVLENVLYALEENVYSVIGCSKYVD